MFRRIIWNAWAVFFVLYFFGALLGYFGTVDVADLQRSGMPIEVYRVFQAFIFGFVYPFAFMPVYLVFRAYRDLF